MTLERGIYRLGCDIGGTFTDFVLIDQSTGEIEVDKRLTTPADPSTGVLEGVQSIAQNKPDFPANADSILHASTLVINALIERKGARTGLITTRGFRDILEIRNTMRYDSYDIFIEFPTPLVPRYMREEVTERTYYDGHIGIPLDVNDLKRAIAELQRHDVESIAVCFLHSYANPFNEKKAKDLLSDLAPSLPLSLSSEVLPEVREYVRTSTTVVNAYTKPLAVKYVTGLLDGLHSLGFRKQLLIMLSSGGMITAETATEFPVRVIESGPAAGAVAAAYVGKLAGYNDLLSFDMGGTTAKGCVIRQGAIDKSFSAEVDRMHRFRKGSGIPLGVPIIDLVEIGAGGGSIAKINDMGLMQVGPESAGASPGPACYGSGGIEPTVSDAALVLGYLNAGYFLGGEMRLDEKAAKAAIEDRIAKPLGLSVPKAAWGIVELVTENMAVAIRIHMAEKGIDPSRYTLVGFGGAGPILATTLARRLGIHRVLIPPFAGIASAFGLLACPISFDLVRTHRVAMNDLDLQQMEALFREMETETGSFIAQAEMVEKVTFDRSLDLCYVGQDYSVNVSVPSGGDSLSKENIRDRFESVYQKLYGRVYPEIEVQLMNLRLVAQGSKPPLELKKIQPNSQMDGSPKGRRPAYAHDKSDYIEHTVYDRYTLPPGMELTGPSIIEERESTIIIDSNSTARVDDYGTLVISLKEWK